MTLPWPSFHGITGFVTATSLTSPTRWGCERAVCTSSDSPHLMGRSLRMSLSPDNKEQLTRREILGAGLGLGLTIGGELLTRRNIVERAQASVMTEAAEPTWEQVNLPAESTLFDMDMDSNSKHGWVVGARGTVLETQDGGESWDARAFEGLDVDTEEEARYRYEVVTFLGDEGWVIGKPSLLLHTKDNGKNWERVPLSPKLPGEPCLITALGNEKAEMTTTAGAVYVTENGGRNWKAKVKETIDATLNRTVSSGVSGASYFTGSIISVLRDITGSYMAVSSRGNFFLTWQPGQDFWIPHGRDTSRRIQAMGFINNNLDDGVWMSTRGGGLGFSQAHPDLTSTATWKFDKRDVKSGGYGILDVGFRPKTDEIWAALGGGTMFYSKDGGKSWNRDRRLDKIGANIYKIKFFGPNLGFALGSGGVLLKYRTGQVV